MASNGNDNGIPVSNEGLFRMVEALKEQVDTLAENVRRKDDLWRARYKHVKTVHEKEVAQLKNRLKGLTNEGKVQSIDTGLVNTLMSYIDQRLSGLNLHKGPSTDLHQASLLMNTMEALPEKFKMPDIGKFKGTSCPDAHVDSYIWAMLPKKVSPQIMAQCFPLTLDGVAKDWYMGLPISTRLNWDAAMLAFKSQYQGNSMFRPTKKELESTMQMGDESFGGFYRRWNDKLAEMVDRPSKKEQMDIFLKCLKMDYRTNLSGAFHSDFASMYDAGIRVDNLLREMAESSYETSFNDEGFPSNPSNDMDECSDMEDYNDNGDYDSNLRFSFST